LAATFPSIRRCSSNEIVNNVRHRDN